MKTPTALLLPASLLLAAALVSAGCPAATRQLRVIQTTDVHGFYDTPADSDGAPTPGGLRRLAARLDREAEADTEVLLIDSGDMWSGTLLSDRREGAPGVAAYNALGYAATALGNHEFDYGPAGLGEQAAGADPFGALKQRLSEARFPVLAANLRDRTTGKLPDWPNLRAATIVERAGLRIGIIGVITEETPTIAFPYVGQALEFADVAATVTREAQQLRAQQVDLVFVLAHLGGGCKRFDDPDDRSSCQEDSELFNLAVALPRGLVDAIFGGHSHQQVAHRVGDIAIIQAGAQARALGVLDVVLRPEQRPELRIHPPEPLVAGGKTPLVAKVDAVLAPLEAEVAELRAEKLGARLVEPLTRSYDDASPLGSFLCDALVQLYPDHPICLLNPGGLRRDLPAGDLTYGALYDVMPFGNHVATAALTGAELLELLRVAASGAHGALQVAGLHYVYDRAKDPCPAADRNGDGAKDAIDRDRLLSATLASGAAIDPAATYQIVTNSFLASGGGGFTHVVNKLPAGRVQIRYDQLPAREQIAALLRRTRPILNSRDKPVMPTPRVEARGAEANQRCAP